MTVHVIDIAAARRNLGASYESTTQRCERCGEELILARVPVGQASATFIQPGARTPKGATLCEKPQSPSWGSLFGGPY